MAILSQGIVGGDMAWPLIIVGIAMGISLILVQVQSPMLVCVGMYLPLETTFAIFIGGLITRNRRQVRSANGATTMHRRPVWRTTVSSPHPA